MYTGPCYYKYNFILRGAREELSNDFVRNYLRSVCKKNTYPTTLHHMSIGVTRLSRLTQVSTVYRAPGGNMPRHFNRASADGVRGGCEMGFMSTTTDVHEAKKYAASSGVPLLFEIHQGACSRGASLAWLSQFPSEAEILLPPISVLEVRRVRSEGAFQVLELYPSTSFGARLSDHRLQAYERQADILWQICCGADARDAVAALATRLAEQHPPKMLRVSHQQPRLGQEAFSAASGLNFDVGGDAASESPPDGQGRTTQIRTQLASLSDLTQIHQVRRELVAAATALAIDRASARVEELAPVVEDHARDHRPREIPLEIACMAAQMAERLEHARQDAERIEELAENESAQLVAAKQADATWSRLMSKFKHAASFNRALIQQMLEPSSGSEDEDDGAGEQLVWR